MKNKNRKNIIRPMVQRKGEIFGPDSERIYSIVSFDRHK